MDEGAANEDGLEDGSSLSNLPDCYQPELVDFEAIDRGNELLLSVQELQRRGRFTAERAALNERRYREIVAAVAEGIGVRQICRAFGVSHNTVSRIRERESALIDTEKQRLSRLAFDTARMAIEGLRDDLAEGKVLPRDKSILAGIMVDKGLVLAGEASVIVEHRGNLEEAEELARLGRELASIPMPPDTESGVLDAEVIDNQHS